MKIKLSFFTQFLFCILFSFYGKTTSAQDCEFPLASLPLTGNNISARINLAGDLFWDRYTGSAAFHNPTITYPFPSTIFTHGLWVGAMDADGQLKVAASTYNTQNRFDYTAGPISGNCENYDRLWEVYGYEIQQHISDFVDNGIIDNPIPNIIAYPAHQNPFFEIINGFALPDTPQGLAPFFDNNNDGIYNPLDGDYPLPHHVAPDVIPAHIIWGISNDGTTSHTASQGQPLNIEVQLTAWSLSCTNNEQINNTIFTSYKIINRNTTTLDSTFIGFHTDGDLGCYLDDYFGSIPDMNTFYLYNQDSIDGSNGTSCAQNLPTYGEHPPVQAVTLLNHSMSSINYFNIHPQNESLITAPPYLPDEFYNYLNGLWRDGSPLTFGGSGYNPGLGLDEVKYVFPNSPNDSSGWSMYNNNLPSGYNNVISSAKIGNFLPDESIILDLAFTFYQDENLDHIESVNMVYDQTPILQQLYDNQFSNVCEINHMVCENDCVWTGDANRDSIVNTFDFLQIGVAQGENGTERNEPLIWYPYTGENWNSTIQDIDLKHTDCNGDGIINEIDFELSAFYLQNSYKTIPPTDTYNQGDELSIITPSNFNLSSINVGETGRCYVKQNQAIDLYGITFTLEYDPSFLKLNTSLGNAPSNPWSPAPTTNEFYNFYDVEAFKGNITSCYVKTNGINGLSKDGNLLMVYFDPIPTDYAQVQTFIKLKNIKAILNDGSQIDYGANELEVNIFNPDGVGVILSDEDFAKENIEIFPNPTSHLLNIKFDITTNAQFSIFDIYGKNIFQQKVNNNKETTLPIEHLSSGIYFLKIKMEGKEITHKFVKI